ncbi:MAG: TolC family protein [Planctomycetaceae bacterium]|nr:TolC family protein [Planctomycetaceae bacterium]
MKMNIAQWIVCSAACMAVGCSGLERHIRPSEQATVYASPSLQSDAVSQSKKGIDTPLDQNHALRSQPVSQAAYAHQSSQASGVVEPASVDVVMVDPVTSNEAIADGATLEGLLSLAFANNPAIKELAATTQIAAGYRTQVGLYANPMLGYQGQQLADAGTDQHLLFVQQQIITGDKRALNRAVLNEAVRAQVQELEAQKLRVATDIKTAYYDSLRIQEQLASIDQFFELLKQGVNAAEKRMQAGEGSKIDLLQTQVQLKQLELDRRQLSASLSARLREIVALAGMPNIQLQAVAGELPKLPANQDWKAVEDGLVATSPEYAAAQARIRQASAAIRRQESQPLPNLNVQFGAGVDNSTDSGMMNVQVGAPIPVFNKNQGNIAAARAEYCRAVQEAQRIDNAIRARLAIASGDYARAAEAVDMYLSELLPAAQETLDLAEGAYRAGEQDFIQLLVTRRTYFDTNLAYIAARAQLATAQAQIDGYLLTGALNAVINNSGDDSLRGLTLDQE